MKEDTNEFIMEENKMTQSQEDNPTIPKNLDIFQHLKLNIKNELENCKCQSDNTFYCIPCKVSVCERCNLDDHRKHILILKKDFELNESKVNEIFTPIETLIATNPVLSGGSDVKNTIVAKIDEFVNDLNEKVQKFKEEKYKEINELFENVNANSSALKNKISFSKDNIKTYLQKNKKFFNLPDNDFNSFSSSKSIKSANLDQDNTYFLLNYDIINLVYQKNKTLSLIAQTLEEDINTYRDTQKEELDKMKNEIDAILFQSSGAPKIEKINLSQTSSAKKERKSSMSSLSNSASKQSRVEDNIIIENIDNSPASHVASTSNDLGKNHFDDINARVNKYNIQIESFKRGIFNTYQKYGNFKEVERLISVYEKTKQKGADGLFSERKGATTQKNKSEADINPKIHLSSKDDIILNNPLLNKYFSYLTMDLYGNNFRMMTKELQSSHADLMIKVNEDEDTDYGKALEGTCEIMLYEKRNNKMTKRTLKLTRNPFGYTKFPIGCRSLLIGDKLYITGGKDEHREYGNVLIYDRKKNTIKRIMDMREPRSYHTMIFNEVFDTIMVFGGENKSSVEIFDPLTNRWQLLPEMNIPRANSSFFFDKPRGIMYSMFGIEGTLTGERYSDIIEFLDLSQARKGWVILDYKNKSEIDLKNFMNIYPLNGDLILLYGGVTFRNTTKSVCILNLVKSEVNKIDPKLLEQLRIESKKSRRLSSIVSGLTLSTSSLK